MRPPPRSVVLEMAAGVVLNPRPSATNVVDDVIAQARRAFEDAYSDAQALPQIDAVLARVAATT